mmetsp:Transcript_46985/g.56812  ORF Transcript_46985/g.56812 Transcript_46985/m.56812 type:complete len:267 (-) Transcript_46985:105-905(-)
MVQTRHNMATRARSAALSRLNSALTQRIMNDNSLSLIRKINVTNDCFYIWHSGSYGTINGFRLGSYVPAVPTTTSPSDENAATVGSSAGALGRMDFFQSGAAAAAAAQCDDKFKVPWSEINAGLGTVALLLVVLSEKSSSRIKYQSHSIAPSGSFSKVAILSNSGRSATSYNLFSDDSFQIFGKRNFNNALNGLLRCLADATVAAARFDKTVAPPHSIEEIAKGEYAIGGLPIAYSNNGERWTRALKYFLTNLKWLVAYTAKHVDQ